MNVNSINALLKIIEEPTSNVHFILINNNKTILKTLSSRCINFKISISHKESLEIANKLLNGNIENLINDDLIFYYLTPGNIYYLIQFADENNYDLSKIKLKDFLKIIIRNQHYKKNYIFSNLIFDFIQFYFIKITSSFSNNFQEKYSYFVKRISDTKKFNLDEESLFIEFEEEILNG